MADTKISDLGAASALAGTEVLPVVQSSATKKATVAQMVAAVTTVGFAAGTAAAPSITWTGDTNTGLYSDAADTIRFSTAGTLRATIGSGGNVSIGATSLAAKLGVTQTVQDEGFILTAATPDTDFRVVNTTAAGHGYILGAGGTGSGFPGSFYLYDLTAPAARLVIDSTGTVTIGSASITAAGLGSFAGVTLTDATNLVVGSTTGTKIGTATTQKIGFYNATPIVQGASVADASGGVTIDAEARTAINALISRIEALGLIATV